MQIGWIDYSKEERNRIVSVLRLLGTQGTIDEIGIGSVRDAFSDLLFPGISVLQTRAKYFVLIPYLFEKACEETAAGRLHSGKQVRDYIEKSEYQLVDTLVKCTRTEADKKGIIGSRNHGSKRPVKMKPSSIYWNGLRTSSILLHGELSLDMACNAVYQRGRMRSKIERKYETADSAADDQDVTQDGHLIFAPIHAKYDFMKEAQIGLRPEEAQYIARCFEESDATRDAVMAYMLKHPDLIWEYERFDQFKPQDFPGELSRRVSLAKEFADFIYGAHLLYNMIFADGCGVDDEKVQLIRKSFDAYCDTYQSPHMNEILHMTNCQGKTAAFLREFDCCISEKRIGDAKELIRLREAAVKTNRRKLLRPKEYQYKEPIHYFKLEYRYGNARQIMMDIIEGLEA